MKILLIDYHGSPSASEVEIAESATVLEVLNLRHPDCDPTRCLVRVNSYVCGLERTLRHGDKVSIRRRVNDRQGRPFKHTVTLSARRAARNPQADLERRWYIAAAAVDIREQLLGASQPQSIDLPVQTWAELLEYNRRFQEARSHGWCAAADSVLFDLHGKLTTLRQRLASVERRLAILQDLPPVPTAGAIASALARVCAEFHRMQVDLPNKSITVRTKRIRIERVDLGPFDIVFNWRDLGQTCAFEAVAVEPNRPIGHPTIPHPHVRGARLPGGHFAESIASELASGGLLKCFQLVQSRLETYDPDTAHVLIQNWYGQNCVTCGRSIAVDIRSDCERCGAAVCDECTCRCERCGADVCTQCAFDCTHCGKKHCNGCVAGPAGRGKAVCRSCGSRPT